MTDIELGNFGEFPEIPQFSGTGKKLLKLGRSGNLRSEDSKNIWGFLGTKSPKFLMFEVGTRNIFWGIIEESPFFPKISQMSIHFS